MAEDIARLLRLTITLWAILTFVGKIFGMAAIEGNCMSMSIIICRRNCSNSVGG